MSLHDVVIELLYGGFPKSETDRDRLLAAVREDQLAQLYRDAPKVVPDPPADVAPPEVVTPRYDPATGERLQ